MNSCMNDELDLVEFYVYCPTAKVLVLFDSDNLWDAIRREATLSGRQLLFDFGSSDASIVRAAKLGNSEEYNLHDKREEIALRVAYAYLQISESRRLTQLNRRCQELWTESRFRASAPIWNRQ